jgi:hypothetical protein
MIQQHAFACWGCRLDCGSGRSDRVAALAAQVQAEQPIGRQARSLRHDSTGQRGRARPGDCASANARRSPGAAGGDGYAGRHARLDARDGGAILNSRVPVIVYVSPAGARAGSAGFFLLESADIAAMAPGTNAGRGPRASSLAASPTIPRCQKIENDAEAFCAPM